MSGPGPNLLRPLAGLAVLVLALGLANTGLDHRRAARRQLTAALRPVVDPRRDVVPDRVRGLRLSPPGSAADWEYRREGGVWRYPALHGAYAAGDRVDQLLGGLLGAAGTVVSTDPDDFAGYGLSPQQAVRVGLEDGAGTSLLEVLLGRPAPDDRGGEAYVRVAGSDTVLHLHANPRLVLAGGAPPMLDPGVLPRGLERRPLVEIRF
ncbi:MAG: DUF4340 domain-containing protein, partial [Gemmatimonadota bacterium]